jgi:hypothetical protein
MAGNDIFLFNDAAVGNDILLHAEPSAGAVLIELTVATFTFVMQAGNFFQGFKAEVTTAVFTFTAQAANFFTNFTVQLSAAVFSFAVNAVDYLVSGGALGGKIRGFLVNVAKGLGR